MLALSANPVIMQVPQAAEMAMRDYYTLLGVDRHASQEALRHAYRAQIKAYHPDHNPGDLRACDRVREVVEAYHVLSDTWTKREYDRTIGHGPACLVTQAYRRESVSFQWIPKLMLLFVFFGVLAGMIYGGTLALDSRTPVFRPQLGVITASPDPDSPAILGRPIPKAGMNVAHEDPVIAGNIVCRVCLQTALYAHAEANSGIGFFTGISPASSF